MLLVFHVFPHAQCTVTSWYSGWIFSFISGLPSRLRRVVSGAGTAENNTSGRPWNPLNRLSLLDFARAHPERAGAGRAGAPHPARPPGPDAGPLLHERRAARGPHALACARADRGRPRRRAAPSRGPRLAQRHVPERLAHHRAGAALGRRPHPARRDAGGNPRGIHDPRRHRRPRGRELEENDVPAVLQGSPAPAQAGLGLEARGRGARAPERVAPDAQRDLRRPPRRHPAEPPARAHPREDLHVPAARPRPPDARGRARGAETREGEVRAGRRPVRHPAQQDAHPVGRGKEERRPPHRRGDGRGPRRRRVHPDPGHHVLHGGASLRRGQGHRPHLPRGAARAEELQRGGPAPPDVPREHVRDQDPEPAPAGGRRGPPAHRARDGPRVGHPAAPAAGGRAHRCRTRSSSAGRFRRARSPATTTTSSSGGTSRSTSSSRT